MHWTLCYGTYQTGSYFWRNYYYLQTDNDAKFGGDPKLDKWDLDSYNTLNTAWKQMDWYLPFLLVQD
jgi:hypothetical protein